MNDTFRLITAHGDTVMANPLRLYMAVLPVIPQSCVLARRYPREENQLWIRVGRDRDWPGHLAEWTSHIDWVRSVAFSVDGMRVVSGSNDRTVRMWDAATGNCTAVFEGHTRKCQIHRDLSGRDASRLWLG
jgi:WD40 repeat protein